MYLERGVVLVQRGGQLVVARQRGQRGAQAGRVQQARAPHRGPAPRRDHARAHAGQQPRASTHTHDASFQLARQRRNYLNRNSWSRNSSYV